MAVIEIALDPASRRLMERLRESRGPSQLLGDLLKLFERLASLAAGHIVATQLSGQTLKRRTAQLARAVAGQALMRNGVPAFRVGVFRGPALKYAGALERGAHVKPVRAKALAMPVDDGLTGAGVARFTGPRQAGDLAFVPYRRGGKAIGGLYDRASLRASGGDLRAASRLYVLLREVNIPAFHYLRNGMRSFIPMIVPELTKVLRDFIRAGPAAIR